MKKFIPFLTTILLIGISLAVTGETLVPSSLSYCEGATGVTFTVHNSVAGNSYTLQNLSGGIWSAVDEIPDATGGDDIFPLPHLAGIYKLLGVSGQITIAQTLLPETLFNITVSVTSGGKITANGAGYCSGSSTFPTIGTDGSQPGTSGVIYKLYKDGIYTGVQFTGTGAPISFGQIAGIGTYIVKAERNGCSRDMTGSQTISIFTLPTVNFTPSYLLPPDQCGSVSFTPVISYVPVPTPLPTPYAYSWNFGGSSIPPTSTSANPTSQFPAYGTSTQSFPVSLQVTDNNGCVGNYNNNVTVTQRPDAFVQPKLGVWNNCNSDPSATFMLTIINKSTTSATNTGYLIDWDDPDSLTPGGFAVGGVPYTTTQFPYNGEKTHIYTGKGSFHLKVTALGPVAPGCNDSKTFPVFNGSTPTGGITYAGGTLEGCAPYNITFFLDGDAQNNAPTTLYTFHFGDGSPDYSFTQETMPLLQPDNKYHISHLYSSVSCNEPGYSFTFNNTIQNPCSTIPNNVGGIKISRKSESDFLRAEFPADPIYVCAGVSRVYTNNTNQGCIIYGGTVINATNYYWDFNDDGVFETTGMNPSHTFATPGTYTVTLKSYTGEGLSGNCGSSEITRTVCVQAEPVSSFGFPSAPPLCINTPYTPVNNSTTSPTCAVPQYIWSVSPSTGVTFLNSTNSNSFQPDFNFAQAGIYTITLLVRVNSGYSVCATATHQEIITIVGPPTITVNQSTIEQCGPGTISMSSSVTYNSNQGTISDYLWAITPPGPPPVPVITNPANQFPTITFSADVTQAYSVTVKATDECGFTTSSPITVNLTQTITDNSITPPASTDLCSGMTISDIMGNIPTGGTGTFTYQWYIQEGAGSWNPVGTSKDLHYLSPLTVNPTSFKRKATSGSCSSESNLIEFTVYPGILNNTITSPQVICNGNPPSKLTGSTPTQGTGSYTYLWKQSTDSPGFTTWVDATGTNDEIDYTPPALLTLTTRYKRIVTSGLCNLASTPVEITVNQIPAINSPNTSLKCSDVALNYAITSNVTGTKYAWSVIDLSGGLITGWNNYSGGTLNIIPDVLSNSSSTNQTIQYTITPTGPLPTQCPGSDFTLIVTVRPKFNSTYSNQSINVFTSTTLTGSISGGTPGYTYSWTPVNKIAPGQNNLANPVTTLLGGTQPYTLTVTDAEGCTFSQVVTVSTGGAAMTVNLTSSATTICNGSSVTLTATASGGGGGGIPGNYTYTWSGIPGGATYPQPWIVQFVPVTIGSNNYTVDVNDGFTTVSSNTSVTVNKKPTITSNLTKQICSGEDVDYMPASDVAGTTFVWTRSANTCLVSSPTGNSGSGKITNILTNGCLTSESVNYTITPTGPAPTFCPGNPVTLVVDVTPIASITNTSNTQIINAGLPSTPVTLNSDVSGVSYSWQEFSVSCSPYLSGYLTSGTSAIIPSQTFSILPGGPPNCEIVYKAYAYIPLPGGKECQGPPFYYTYTVNLEPAKYDLICPVPGCEGTSVSITLANSDFGVDYQLLKDGIPYSGSPTPQPGCNCQIVWSGITENGTFTILGTNTSNGVSVLMNNPCVVTFNPNPLSNYVIGSTGHCPGDLITLNGSQSGVAYELYLNGTTTSEVHNGPGVLNFTNTDDAGIYTIKATVITTGCNAWIDGNIIINDNPLEFVLSPAGDLCVGDNLFLTNSQTGVDYELWCNPLIGPGPTYIKTMPGSTGSPVPFGQQTIAGTYYVHATNTSTSCDVTFPELKIFRPTPLLFSVTPQATPGIPICGATTIGVENSQSGYIYFLHKINPGTGLPYNYPYYVSPVIGTGSSISFPPPVSESGEYVVIAWDPDNICPSRMNGSVVIHDQPAKYWIIPQDGPYCIDQGVGMEIRLEHSDIGVDYTLNPGSVVIPGIGGTGPLSFGFQTSAGTYTITAKDNVTGCESQMNGSLILQLNPTQYTMYPLADFCPGDYEISTSGSQSNVRYTLFTPNTTPIAKSGGSGPLNWGKFYYPGTYYIQAEFITGNPCPVQLGSVDIHPRPGVFQVLLPSGGCDPATICLSGAEPNIRYDLFNGVSIVETFTPLIPGVFCFPTPHPVGTYTVIATNLGTDCDTLMNGVAIVGPIPVPTISGAGTVCAGTTQTYTTEPGMTNYTWTITGGTGSSSSNTISVVWGNVASGEVIISYSDPITSCSAASPAEKIITINPAGQLNDPANVVACNGILTAGIIFTTSNTGGSTSYTWTNSQPSIGLPGTGTGNIPGFTATNTGTSPVVATITVTPTFSSGGVDCIGTARTFTITVNPTGQVNNPSNLVVCSGNQTGIIFLGTNNTGGLTTYNWINNLPSIGLPANGTGNIPDFMAVNAGTAPVVASITITPVFSFGGVDCTGTSQTFTITVNPTGQVNTLPDLVFCHESIATAGVFSTNNTGGTTTYNWTNSNSSIGIAPGGTGNIPSFTATNSGTAPAVATITVIPTYTNGGINCPGNSMIFTITVNPKGQVILPANLVVCNGNFTVPAVFGTNNTVGTTTYNWTNTQPSIGIPSTGTGNLPSFTAINTGTAPVVAIISVTPTFTFSGVNCQGDPVTFTITVNPSGQVNAITDLVICNGTLTTPIIFGTNNTGGNVTYNWTNSQTSIGLPASGTGNIPAFTATNNGTAPSVASITVTPEFSFGGVDCPGASQTFTITVNPAGQLNDPPDIVVCNGSPTTLIIFTTNNTGGNTTYNWSNSNPSIGLSASGTGNIPGFSAINTGTSPILATITVTPVFTNGAINCPGTIQTFTITVNPSGQVNPVASQLKCSNDLTDPITFSTLNTGGTTTYTWTNTNPGIGLPASGSGDIASFTAVNNGVTALTATITVIPHFTNETVTCDGPGQTFTITVFSAFLAGSITADHEICYNSAPAKLTGIAPAGGNAPYSYQWEFSTDGINWTNVPSLGTSLDYQPGVLLQTTMYRLRQTSSTSCGSKLTNVVTITVQVPTANAGPDESICGLIPYMLAQSSATFGVSYSWSTSGTGTFSPQYQLHSTYFPSPADMTLGSVILTLTITDNCGFQVSDYMILHLGQIPVAFYSFSSPACSNTPVSFHDMSTVSNGYINKWEWDFDDGSVTPPVLWPENPDIQHSFTPPGPSYLVKLHVYTSLGCSAEFQQVVNILQAPVANFSYSTIRCDNEPVQFTNTSALNGAQGMQPWLWDFGDPESGTANTSNLSDPIHQFSHSGDFTVSLTVINSNNCQDIMVKQPVQIGKSPFADFTYTPACEGTGTQFTDASLSNATSILTYSWDFGDGTLPSNLQNPSHIFLTYGTKNVRLTITNNLGCVKDTVKQVLVNPRPVPGFTFSTPSCVGTPVQFTDQSTTLPGFLGSIVTWQWDFGDGSVTPPISFPSSPNISHTFPATATTYTVRLTVTTSNGCTAYIEHIVTNVIAPIASFTCSSTACSAQPVQFTDSSVPNGGGNIQSWLWNFDDTPSGTNNVSTLQNPIHNFSAPGYYNVSLTVTNQNGCTSSYTITPPVNISTGALANFTATSACLGTGTVFTDASVPNSGIVVGWHWDFGDGQYSNSSNPVHSYSFAGNFNVNLTITTSTGCIKDTTKLVQIFAKPIAAYLFTPSACSSDSVYFTDASVSPHGFVNKWVWDFGDGSVPVTRLITDPSPNVAHKFPNGGTFAVKLTITSSDLCIAEKINNVPVQYSPMANFDYAAIRCANSPLQFTDITQLNGGTGLVGWSWNFGDVQSGINNTSTVQNPQHSYLSGGPKTVVLIVTNASGCKDTIQKTFTVNATPVASFTATASCISSPTVFHDISSTATGTTITSWLWNFGDASSGVNNTSTLQNPSHTYLTQGTYLVRLTIHNSSQCEKDTLISIQTNAKPIAQFSSATSCAGDSTYFQDLSIAPGSYLTGWRWDFGDGSPGSTLQNTYHTFAVAGTFNVKLVVTNGSGCQDSVIVPVMSRPKPIADFIATSMYCPKGFVQFEDQSEAVAASITERFWTFEPGYTSNLTDPGYTYQVTNATYPVSLVVTDNHGCKDTIEKNVFVKPGFSFAFTSDTACFNSPVHFSAINQTTGDSLYNVTWNFDDPDSGPDNTSHLYNPVHLFTKTGPFHVQLKAHNSDNCVDSIQQTVTVYKLPVPLFSVLTTPCFDTARFTDLSEAGDGVISRWTWRFGDNTGQTINSPGPGNTYHKYAEGIYSASLKIKNSFGCIDSITQLNNVVITCISSIFKVSDTVCAKYPVLLTDSSTPASLITSWKWKIIDENGGIILDTLYHPPFTSFTYKFMQPGLDTIKQTVTTSFGGVTISDSSLKIILVKPSPTAGFATNINICNHDSTGFRMIQIPGDTITSYRWRFGDPGSGINDTTSLLTDPMHLYSKIGKFWPGLLVINQEGCKDSIYKKITVHKLPVARFSFPDTSCSRQMLELSNTTVQGDTTLRNLSWHFSGPVNPSAVSHSATPDVSYDLEGMYNINLQVEDNFGCRDTVVDTIHIKPSPISSFTLDGNYQGTTGKVKVINTSTGASEYLWTFTNGTPASSNKKNPDVVVYSDTGTFVIRLIAYGDIPYQNLGCSDTSYYEYNVDFKGLFVPNAFAPNYSNYSSDLDVTIFKPVGVGLIKYHVQVFDIWGHLLWESKQLDGRGIPTEGWDGNFNGNLMPQGTYMWKISATFRDGSIWEGSANGNPGGTASTSGSVTLIR